MRCASSGRQPASTGWRGAATNPVGSALPLLHQRDQHIVARAFDMRAQQLTSVVFPALEGRSHDVRMFLRHVAVERAGLEEQAAVAIA